MQDLISVVVPIYNVEKYLIRCIESILKQTYKNIEIILVDDGSKDSCGKICDEYKEKDSRIKVIHKENGGLSDARNAGINVAKGIYICFIDSDDFIDASFIEKLYRMCINSGANIAQCSFNILTNEIKDEEKKAESKIINISAREMLKNVYGKYSAYNISACNKLFKTDLFNNIRFPFGRIHEDEFTTYKLIYLSGRVAITSQKLYNYYIERNGSITQTRFNIKRLDYLTALEERMQFFEENNETELYNKTLEQYCYYIIISNYKCHKHIESSKNIQTELLKKYRKNVKELIKKPKIKLIKKVILGLAYIFPITIAKILNNRSEKKLGRENNER